MKLQDWEVKTLRKLRVGVAIPVWRAAEPQWREGRLYIEDTLGDVTVLSVLRVSIETIKIKDVKKVGITYADLMDGLRAAGATGTTGVWETRIAKGDLSGKPRLMQTSGRKSGDYTDRPEMAMRGEPEALTREQLDEIDRRGAVERKKREEEFRLRTIEEARELFGGEAGLRAFERVTEALGRDRRA